ncbi:hypothetical protein EVA_12120 [gut metagenome]|uniref:Uncharacterized protein n=1 Tax=gut metagenome TaxID=749906 RepID=J9GJJ9_9ZZZZ
MKNVNIPESDICMIDLKNTGCFWCLSRKYIYLKKPGCFRTAGFLKSESIRLNFSLYRP